MDVVGKLEFKLLWLQEGVGGPYGVNLYGVKPPLKTYPNCTKLTAGDNTTTCIHPFNASQWSQY